MRLKTSITIPEPNSSNLNILPNHMLISYRILLVSGALIFARGISGCTDQSTQAEEKKGYILPDSLLKTIEIDTVTNLPVLNSLTLTGKVDFNEDNVIKIFPVISGQVSDIKVMAGDYVKEGQVLAMIRSSEMAGYSNDYQTAKSNVDLTKKSLDATEDMFKSGLASQRDQLAAQEGYNQAVSAFEKSKRILSLNAAA